MKFLKDNATIIRQALFVLLAVFLVATSLIVFIMSIEVYDDGYGTEFSVSTDYVVAMIMSTIILIYSIYCIVKPNGNLVFARILTLGLTGSIGGLYSIGAFAKKLIKGNNYPDVQLYLYFGLICLALALIAFFQYLETKKD